jgi:hypothetical protein
MYFSIAQFKRLYITLVKNQEFLKLKGFRLSKGKKPSLQIFFIKPSTAKKYTIWLHIKSKKSFYHNNLVVPMSSEKKNRQVAVL